MFSHFSFHFRNLWYNPSFTIQSILGPSMYGTNVCPSWGLDGSFLHEFLVVILYYFYGALDNLVSGQNSTQYTLTWVKLLVMLVKVWTFHWNAAELLSNEFRFVHNGAESTDWYLTYMRFPSSFETQWQISSNCASSFETWLAGKLFTKKLARDGNQQPWSYSSCCDAKCTICLWLAGYQIHVAWIPPGQAERQLEVCATNLTLSSLVNPQKKCFQ